jgi:pyridinium-3,5-biscarboxylic acid mononucleotide sulfurtransferase
MNVAADETVGEKRRRLRAALGEMGSVVVAFSAGVDSTVVLKVALDVLGRERVLAATGVSPSLARRELESVKELAGLLDAPLELVGTDEVNDPNYAANPTNRCYHCKTELYTRLAALAKQRGFAAVANGVNADDVGDWRPGMKAAQEWAVRAPLLEAGLNKADVRALAKELGLPNWAKPALACLSSRVPYGTPVTVGVLSQVERAEAFLYERGFTNFRVRHHQRVARIEASAGDMRRLMDDEALRGDVVSAFKELGYTYIALDLQGFRSGSGNEGLSVVGGR